MGVETINHVTEIKINPDSGVVFFDKDRTNKVFVTRQSSVPEVGLLLEIEVKGAGVRLEYDNVDRVLTVTQVESRRTADAIEETAPVETAAGAQATGAGEETITEETASGNGTGQPG